MPSRKSVKLRRQPAEKKQKLQRGSCTTIKLQLYNYRVYSCTTKGVTVVRQQGVPTRLDRGADCSQQTCRLGSAGLSSLVATMEKLLPSTRNDTFSNPRRDSFRHGKKFFPTRKDAYPPPPIFIPSSLTDRA